MIIEGTVVKVNESLSSFEVNNLTISLVFRKYCKLPAKGTNVKIITNKFNKKQSITFLNDEDELEGCVTSNVNSLAFVNEVRRLALQPPHIIMVHEIYNKMLMNVDSNFTDAPEDLILKVVPFMIESGLDNNSLAFLNELKFVSKSQEYYENFDYWTFGNHYSNKKCLFGYLFVDENYGIVFFTDSTRKIPCCFTHSQQLIGNYLNHYILIKNFIILSEIFNGSKFHSIDSILINFDDICVIKKVEQVQKRLFYTDQVVNYRCSFYLKILNKSLPLVNSQDFIVCWLEIFSENSGKSFINLDSSYAQIFPLLREGHTYKFYHNSNLEKCFHKDFRRLNPSYAQMKVPPDGIFIHQQDLSQEESIMSVKEAIDNRTDNLVSFQGKIIRKTFVNNSNRAKSMKYFSTPGEKTHLLKFGSDGKQLNCYLNDWETKLTPYALIPDMVVIVRNVVLYNNYYKSTPFTRINIHHYEPGRIFNSVNLRFGTSDWSSEPDFLGLRDPTIPYDVVVWGRVISLNITHVKINYNTKFSVLINFLATDQKGEARIYARDSVALDFLQLLIEAQDGVFQKWIEGLKVLKSFEFNNSKEQTNSDFLSNFFQVFNELSLTCIDLMCRKTSEESGEPIYTLLAVRK